MTRASNVGLRVRWRRLSIRIKLLIPVMVALLIGLVFLLWRVPPPINALVETNIRTNFSSRLNELRPALAQFMDGTQADLLDLVSNADLDSYFMAQASTIRPNCLPRSPPSIRP
jgi:hypothetical protein